MYNAHVIHVIIPKHKQTNKQIWQKQKNQPTNKNTKKPTKLVPRKITVSSISFVSKLCNILLYWIIILIMNVTIKHLFSEFLTTEEKKKKTHYIKTVKMENMQSISAWRWKGSANSFYLLLSFLFLKIWIESCYAIIAFRPDMVSIPWLWSGKSAYLIIYVIKGHQERVEDKGNPVRSDRFLRGSPRFQFVQTIDYITKLFHQDGIQRNALM